MLTLFILLMLCHGCLCLESNRQIEAADGGATTVEDSELLMDDDRSTAETDSSTSTTIPPVTFSSWFTFPPGAPMVQLPTLPTVPPLSLFGPSQITNIPMFTIPPMVNPFMRDKPIEATPNFFTFTTPKPPMIPTLPTLPNPLNSTMKPINITIDPEALMDVPEIVSHWGYPVETHKAITSDGYILTLHRIPHGKKNKNLKGPRPVVFLQHGLLCTSSIWLLNLPHQSAGFIFADEGYDVWLGNMRGNTYSKKHARLHSTSPMFWKFSWEEHARYDLPAMIDYVLKTTKQENLYYVGHSQGALTMFAKLSQDQDFSKKIRKFFAMAPVSRMSNIKGVFYDLGQIYDQYQMVYQVFGDSEFLSNNIFTKLFTDILCDQSVNKMMCENFIFAVSGPNSNQFNTSRIGIYLAHNPAGTSSRNMLHFAQMVHTKKMASFNMGQQYNILAYHTNNPPEYDLSQINSSIYLYYSDSDWLANGKDVEGYLMKVLPQTTLKKATKLKDFNHNDFLWGMRAREEIYEKIMAVVNYDFNKISMQHGVPKYIQSLPSSLPSTFSEHLMQQLNDTVNDLD